jgi:pyruvate/2-oxoglutarate/acetoin dehydrogenase E1 component
MGVGAAITGMRPVVEILFVDFTSLIIDPIVNQAAKYRFLSGGKGRVPMVLRTQGGSGGSLAAQHSQSLEAWFYHVPGLKLVMPSTPYDAKGLLKSAIATMTRSLHRAQAAHWKKARCPRRNTPSTSAWAIRRPGDVTLWRGRHGRPHAGRGGEACRARDRRRGHRSADPGAA